MRSSPGRDLARCSATVAVYLLPVMLLGTVQVVAQGKAQASAHDARRKLPITKFYGTLQPLPAGKAGELIRSEATEDYNLSADFSAVRILYHSRSAAGQDVATSGVVLAPGGTPPAKGWPVIAWAHGFTGSARHCAPSLLRNLYYGPFLSMYLNLGYAVVASDYTGLGTDYRSAVLDVPSDVDDVIDSTVAARAAVPELGARWVAMGPSLGGNVAIGVAEREGEIGDSNFLGSIAISGTADLKEAYENLTKENFSGMIEFLAYSIKTVYPDFNVRDLLAERTLPAYHQIDESCGSLENGAAFPASEMLSEKWKRNEFKQRFLERGVLGRKPAYRPLLVIGGGAQPGGLPAMTEQTLHRLCQQGDLVQIDKLAESQAGMVLGDSVRDQMAWIEGRFAGRPATSNCP